jgi:hypothetical protein
VDVRLRSGLRNKLVASFRRGREPVRYDASPRGTNRFSCSSLPTVIEAEGASFLDLVPEKKVSFIREYGRAGCQTSFPRVNCPVPLEGDSGAGSKESWIDHSDCSAPHE